MIPKRFRMLIEKLIEKTECSLLSWEVTGSESEYMAYVGDTGFIVGLKNGGDLLLDELYFHVTDSMGNVQDSATEKFPVEGEIIISGEDGFFIYRIYALAKKSALDMDDFFAKAMNDVELL